MDDVTSTVQAVGDAATTAANETVGKITSPFFSFLATFFTWEHFFKALYALIVIFIIWLVFRLIRRLVKTGLMKKSDPRYIMIADKAVKYIFYVIVAMYVLSLFGIRLSAVWGAAGIAGVAIGFAAQTSVSNLISGIFVLGEGTMKNGDFISVGDQTGTVDSVDLLSVKIHTPDNQMVRIPNSTVINSNFVNNSYFPQRRLRFTVSIDYSSDMQKALDALRKAPDLCPSVLKSPAPEVWFDGFGGSGIGMTLAVWFDAADMIRAKNETFIAVKKVFDEAGISIPFDRLDVSVLNQDGKAAPLS